MAANTGAQINTATDTFLDWVTRTNSLINAMATIVLTAEALPNGSPTSGNVNLTGTFGANVFAAGQELRGGTVETPAALNVSSNVVMGNLTLNVAGSIAMGNSTINSVMNSAVLAIGTGRFSAFVNVGTVGVNTSTIQIGTGAANSLMNSSVFRTGNTTVNTVVNSTSIATRDGVFSNGLVIGTDVIISDGVVRIGNSTINVIINSTAVSSSGNGYIQAATRDAVANNNVLVGVESRLNFISGNGIALGISDDLGGQQINVVITALAQDTMPGGTNTYVQFNDGGGFNGTAGLAFDKTTNTLSVANTLSVPSVSSSSNVRVGNTTVYALHTQTGMLLVLPGGNVVVNSTGFFIGNSVLSSTGWTVGNSTVNAVANSTQVTASNGSFTQVTGNTLSLVSRISVGNATVNATINSTAVVAQMGNFTSNVVVGTTLSNTTAYSVGNATIRSVLSQLSLQVNSVFTNSISVGNVDILGSGFSIGNATVNATMTSTALSINTISVNYISPVTTNTSVLQVGAGFIQGNSTVLRVGNTVIDGTDITTLNFTGNTLVVNTATIGTVTINSTAVAVGNATIKTVINSTAVVVGNVSTAYQNLATVSNTATIDGNRGVNFKWLIAGNNYILGNPTNLREGTGGMIKVKVPANNTAWTYGNAWITTANSVISLANTANRWTFLSWHAANSTHAILGVAIQNAVHE